ncbi:NAD(P)-binding domain-containing protein [Streptomyces sp. C11-1]|uniref:NAD(P)-binding domain-containing protein n=1 Tax=Streptomyces durocortorensis TaxID=2811104 RepID=A0ABY9VV19_9ACTN|nr:NAD(P)-binding domain-containing protein [Streptomyces durocortorensis]WNF27633.1 NAD(P)-binding domain-containing protein [Streptomyces durocortorensis]
MSDGTERRTAAPHVTVVGLGRMGVAIAAALLDAGYAVTVWNRSPGKDDALVERGAVRSISLARAVAAGPLVLAALVDSASVREAFGPVGEALRGRTLVNLANSSPDQARELADWAAGHGIDYLDGAMMALPETVGTDDAFFLYSGSERAFTTYGGELEVMASAHYFGADPGAAEVHDLAVLSTGYAALTGFLHAVALLEPSGTDPEAFAPLAARWLRGMAAFLPELAQEAGTRSYGDGVSTVDLNRAAVHSLLRLGADHGVAGDVHEPLRALLDRRAAEGHGGDSFSSVLELMRPAPLV